VELYNSLERMPAEGGHGGKKWEKMYWQKKIMQSQWKNSSDQKQLYKEYRSKGRDQLPKSYGGDGALSQNYGDPTRMRSDVMEELQSQHSRKSQLKSKPFNRESINSELNSYMLEQASRSSKNFDENSEQNSSLQGSQLGLANAKSVHDS